MVQLSYDGSFYGFLTCVFEAYQQKIKELDLQPESKGQQSFFATTQQVLTDATKAQRVWKALKNKMSPAGYNSIWYAFLSEELGIENKLHAFIKKVFDSEERVEKNYGDPLNLHLAQTARKVGREKHRMEAFVRFQQLKDGVFFAVVEPDFNVLPLIARHFKSRYADQSWIIYDAKRHYGISYHHEKGVVEEIEIAWAERINPKMLGEESLTVAEQHYQVLWKNYFKSTGIASRKNMKLHIQHVPKRYWKYLIEKE